MEPLIPPCLPHDCGVKLKLIRNKTGKISWKSECVFLEDKSQAIFSESGLVRLGSQMLLFTAGAVTMFCAC